MLCTAAHADSADSSHMRHISELKSAQREKEAALLLAACDAKEETCSKSDPFQDDCFESKPSCYPMRPVMNGYVAPYALFKRCARETFVTASFIYWNAKQDNLDLGYVRGYQTTVETTSTAIDQSENFGALSFKYEPGFQVAIGTSLMHDHWQIFAEYTYLRSNANGKLSGSPISEMTINTDGSVNNGSYVVPEWIVGGLDNFTSQIAGVSATSSARLWLKGHGSWHLAYDMGDIAFSRSMYLGRMFVMKAIAGLRGGSIREKMEAFYSGATVVAPSTNPGISQNYQIEYKLYSWCVGPRVGLEGQWQSSTGFRIFSDASLSLLATKFNRDKFTAIGSLTAAAAQVTTTANGSDGTFTTVIPQADFTIGLGWGEYIANDKCHFDVEVGYTFNAYINQNQFLNSQDFYKSGFGTGAGSQGGAAYDDVEPRGGNLVLQGLTVSASLEF